MKHHNLIGIGLVILAILGGLVWSSHRNTPKPEEKTPNNANSQTSKKSTQSSPSAQTQPAAFSKKQYSLDNPSSIWVVVNKKRQLNPAAYAPSDLTAAGGGQLMRAESALAFSTMITDAKASGFIVSAASGYRSYNTQVAVYNNEVKSYGQVVADNESARPGYSEHQTGLAIDLASGGCSIQDCFGNTPGGKWITANAYKYGFILRYPYDKSSITGYRGEAWHFRYVGVPLATEMHKNSIQTLEEFFGLPAAPTY